MSITLEQLITDMKKTKRKYNFTIIKKAFELANSAHVGQQRVTGEPYIIHPLEVSKILVELGMDTDSVVAALLHDVVEDTDIPIEQIKAEYGNDIALLVGGVTKLGQIPFSSREEQQAENIRKMLLAMSEDIRVIIIKLADRLHNMRTMSVMPIQKQRDKSLETMEVYAPIAHRLGIRALKEELEDLAIAILDPVAYKEIEQALELREEERASFIESIKERIDKRLHGAVTHYTIDGRVKSIHGIYRKMYIQGRHFEEIYDIYAVRIIVDSVIECYNVLGIIHDMFRPIPNRFKDYISTPKQNMYQSLHTTVISKEKTPFEVQIRTHEMHRMAEYGIASHWKYKLGIKSKEGEVDNLSWIRRMLDNQNEEDATDLLSNIKSDLTSDEAFVFTPKGDVIRLPIDSTVIDFAYAIHSAVGNRMIGAKVDGRIVSIDYKVKTGEIVNILTTKEASHGPSKDWLKIVRTSEARNKIRQWYKKERREENILEGKIEIEREFKRNNISLTAETLGGFLLSIAKRQHCASTEDFYAAVGYGGIVLSRIIGRIKDDYLKLSSDEKNIKEEPKEQKKEFSGASGGVIVEGIDNCLVKFARCCNPLPGDDVVGFITRGYGVSIHKHDCKNVPLNIELDEQRDRWVNVHWINEIDEKFKSTLRVVANDRPGLLADLTILLSNMHITINAADAKSLKEGNALLHFTVTIDGKEQLGKIISQMAKVKGVTSVERCIV